MVAVGRARPALLAAAFVLVAPPVVLTQAPPPGAIDDSIQFQVTRARSVAVTKLHAARCLRIFGEFQDLDGRRLEDVLASWKKTAEDRLRELVFRDGSQTSTCQRPGVFAYTSPLSSTIFVCPAFSRIVRQDIAAAANLLIHEELHSLGAGEAPMPGLPSAEEITARVEHRCGR